MSKGASCVFTVECHTKPGECVVLVGSTRELGEWMPAKGVKMMTSEQDFPRWISPPIQVSAPGNAPVSYKYLITRFGQESCRWESGPDRKLEPSTLPRKSKETAHIEDLAFATEYNAETDTFCKQIKRKSSSRVRSASRDRFRESETVSALRATVRALEMQNDALIKESGIRQISNRRFTWSKMFLVALLLLIPLALYLFNSNNLPVELTKSPLVPKSMTQAFPAIALVLLAILIRGMSRSFARRLRPKKTDFQGLPLV